MLPTARCLRAGTAARCITGPMAAACPRRLPDDYAGGDPRISRRLRGLQHHRRRRYRLLEVAETGELTALDVSEVPQPAARWSASVAQPRRQCHRGDRRGPVQHDKPDRLSDLLHHFCGGCWPRRCRGAHTAARVRHDGRLDADVHLSQPTVGAVDSPHLWARGHAHRSDHGQPAGWYHDT